MHGGRAGDDVLEAQGTGTAVTLGTDDGFELVELHGVAQRDDEALGRDGLDEEVDGALAHRRHDRFERGVRGLDDDGRGDAVAGHGFHHRHAVAVRHNEVEDDGAEAGIGAHQAQRFVTTVGGDGSETGAARDFRGQPQLHRIVVHDENARHQVSQAVCCRDRQAESRCAVSEQDEKCELRGA